MTSDFADRFLLHGGIDWLAYRAAWPRPSPGELEERGGEALRSLLLGNPVDCRAHDMSCLGARFMRLIVFNQQVNNTQTHFL